MAVAAVRFLHSADWQLGMHRHFLTEEAAPRFLQARIDAVAALAGLAAAERCEFAVVGGDVFESNQVDRRTVGRALDALAAFPCPVFLLPGNHDPLDAATLYRSREFTEKCPDHVVLLDDTTPRAVRPGVEVVGAPWTSKRPRRDLVAALLETLEPAPGSVRIAVAHGIVDRLSPDRDDPARIALAPVEAALADGRIDFLALGDRHSATEVAPRIWYAGAPEATDYGEVDSGRALVVELEGERCTVAPHAIGGWTFLEERVELHSADDVAALAAKLAALPAKDRTILKLRLTGAVGLAARARLDRLLEESEELFAGLQERSTDLALLPDDLDPSALGLAGFARAAAEELTSADDPEAREALALLYRLAGGAA